MNRMEIIEARLVPMLQGLSGELEVHATLWEEQAWHEEIDATNPALRMGKLLGWLPAEVLTETSIEVQFCPAVIAAVTRDLDDTDFDAFVDIVHMSMALSVANVDVPPIDRAQIIDDRIAQWPGSHQLLTRVQLQAMAGCGG